MSLSEKLAHLRAEAAERLPPEARKILHRATQDLRSSGLLDRVLRVGDSAPSFELPDHQGSTVRSGELLEQGPLVVTFYRGFW